MQASQGELLVWTNVDPEHEAEFDRWYQREHLAERAAIPGFLWGRRYRATAGRRRHLALYRTTSLAVFTTAAYTQAFAHQSPWSRANLARMRDPIRRVAAVAAGFGSGSGGALALIVLPADGDIEAVAFEAIAGLDGIIGGRLLVPDARLSTPLPAETTEYRVLAPLAVIEATTTEAAAAAGERLAAERGAAEPALFRFLQEVRA